MRQQLEKLLHMKDPRSCEISLTNSLPMVLNDPSAYINGKVVYKRLPKTIEPGQTIKLEFDNSGATSGAEGVFTYAIDGTTDTLVILFSVPYHNYTFSNKFNIQAIPRVTASEPLFQTLSYFNNPLEPNAKVSKLYRRDRYSHYEVQGQMTEKPRASMSVSVKYKKLCLQAMYEHTSVDHDLSTSIESVKSYDYSEEFCEEVE